MSDSPAANMNQNAVSDDVRGEDPSPTTLLVAAMLML